MKRMIIYNPINSRRVFIPAAISSLIAGPIFWLLLRAVPGLVSFSPFLQVRSLVYLTTCALTIAFFELAVIVVREKIIVRGPVVKTAMLIHYGFLDALNHGIWAIAAFLFGVITPTSHEGSRAVAFVLGCAVGALRVLIYIRSRREYSFDAIWCVERRSKHGVIRVYIQISGHEVALRNIDGGRYFKELTNIPTAT